MLLAFISMYKAMNVQAVAKPVSEVLPSFNTGFDNTLLFSIVAGWIQPVSHFTLSRHIYQRAAVMYSKSFIDSLPPYLHEEIQSYLIPKRIFPPKSENWIRSTDFAPFPSYVCAPKSTILPITRKSNHSSMDNIHG